VCTEGENVQPDLPPALRAALEQDDLESLTLEVISVGADDWPHLALVSVGEAVPVSHGGLRLALWPTSRSAGNLTRTGRATLAAVADGTAYRLRLVVVPRGELQGPTGPLAVFDAQVVDVQADVVPYAVLEAGIRFRLVDRTAVLARWAATRHWLRGLEEPVSGGP
jgi:hypothetical protein